MVRRAFFEALQDSVATFFAYFPLGVVFGILFTSQMDLPWFLAPCMSLITFAGAVQFVVLGIFAIHGSMIGMFITVTFIALRNSFYGLSLLGRYAKVGFWLRQYLIFGLVDATYSIAQNRRERDDEIPYLFHLNWLIHFYWVSGTFLGALFGEHVIKIPGLDFSLTALFTVFFIEQWKKCKDLSIIIVAFLGFALGWMLLRNQAFLIGIVITMFYLCMKYYIRERQHS